MNTRDGTGSPLVDTEQYYVQEKRTIVGNCTLWWRPNGGGYTTNLAHAGRYTGAEARRMRATDIPWPWRMVERLAVRHVVSDELAIEAIRIAAEDEIP